MMMDFDETVSTVRQNSIKNMHVKGLNYICLGRTNRLTDKFYFFEGDVRHAHEVVNPHDHRYNFVTNILSGSVKNTNFETTKNGVGQTYQKFNFMTPMNGGDGFNWVEEVSLKKLKSVVRGVGRSYIQSYFQIHTIQIMEPDTVLNLKQFEDEIDIYKPTATFTKDKEPPSLSGLYEKFTNDEIVKYLKRIKQLGATP
jgi:hypothetical protein